MRKRRDETRLITLALQGGGAHGAFTWGVLERILEDERLVIEAISGTSAGAMNAAVLADGFEKGGAAGAKQALEDFWRTMSRYGAFSHYFAGPASPFAGWFEPLTRMLSPYQFNRSTSIPYGTCSRTRSISTACGGVEKSNSTFRPPM